MTQQTVKSFIDEVYSKAPKKNCSTSKTDVYYIDNIWSLDILDLKVYGPENNRGFRHNLVVIDKFSKFRWTIPLKNKKARTKKDSFGNIPQTSKRKLKSKETDRGK